MTGKEFMRIRRAQATSLEQSLNEMRARVSMAYSQAKKHEQDPEAFEAELVKRDTQRDMMLAARDAINRGVHFRAFYDWDPDAEEYRWYVVTTDRAAGVEPTADESRLLGR